MLKKIVASLLTSVGLLALTPNAALARPAVDFKYRQTLYPSNCSVFLKGEKFNCDYMVLGAFNDGSANIKVCSGTYCLILMVSYAQLVSISNGNDFYVSSIVLQDGSYIGDNLSVSMRCGFRNEEMSCTGEFPNGSPITVYVD